MPSCRMREILNRQVEAVNVSIRTLPDPAATLRVAPKIFAFVFYYR